MEQTLLSQLETLRKRLPTLTQEIFTLMLVCYVLQAGDEKLMTKWFLKNRKDLEKAERQANTDRVK